MAAIARRRAAAALDLMRLFLGCAPSPAERRVIYDRCQALSLDPELPLRWVPPENWHVTLVFLGEVPEHLLGALADCVGAALAGCRQVALSLPLLGWFPSVSKARLLALEAEPEPAFTAMQRELAAALRGEGFQLEQRPYRPHLTLARYRGARKKFSPPRLPPIRPGSLAVQSVTLFESVSGNGAPRYQPLQQFELQP